MSKYFEDSKNGMAKVKVERDRSRSRSPRRKEEIRVKTEIKVEKDIDNAPKEESKKPENIGLGAKHRLKSMSIQMKIGAKKEALKPNKPKLTVAAAFNQDSDSEPEEMPPEARMRMRNIGRDTPTSSGPNSFGKTKQGFSDAKKIFEKNLRDAMESALADD